MSRLAGGKVLITFEVTPEQREQIRTNALAFGMSTAAFLRHAGLGGTVEQPKGRRPRS